MTVITVAGRATEVTAVICDTVRTESDQRLSLVGVYGRATIFPSFPMAFIFGVSIKMDPAPPENTPVRVRMTYGDVDLFPPFEALLPKPEALAGTDEPPIVNLSVDRFIANLEAPEAIRIWLALGGEPEVELCRLRVMQASTEGS